MSDRVAALVLATSLLCWNAGARDGELRDRQLTRGTINAAISERAAPRACPAKSWTRLHRPSVSVNNSHKKLQMKTYGQSLADTLGVIVVAGAPQDPANLWPQPRFGDWSADRQDVLDAKLCWFAKPLAGDRIVRVRAELSEQLAGAIAENKANWCC